MTREETKKILQVMYTNYPNWNVKDFKAMTDLWEMMLQEYSYKDISVSLKNFILSDTKGFAPSIGQLVEGVHNIKTLSEGGDLNEIEAWGLVYKAICNSSYNSESEFAKLPQVVQKAVGSPATLREWGQMPIDTVQSVEQSHFIRTYRATLAREKEVNKMPSELRAVIGDANKLLISEKE